MLWGLIRRFLIWEHKPMLFCSGKFPLYPCVRGSSPLSPLWVAVYLVLYGGPWSSWTWVSYNEIRMGWFAVSTCWPPVEPAPFVKNVPWMVFPPLSHIKWPLVCWFVSWSSFLLHGSTCLSRPILYSFYHYCSVIQLAARDGHFPRSSFIFENGFISLFLLLLFQMNLKIGLSNSMEYWVEMLKGIALNL